jgi:membrane protein involved in colicin uptake
MVKSCTKEKKAFVASVKRVKDEIKKEKKGEVAFRKAFNAEKRARASVARAEKAVSRSAERVVRAKTPATKKTASANARKALSKVKVERTKARRATANVTKTIQEKRRNETSLKSAIKKSDKADKTYTSCSKMSRSVGSKSKKQRPASASKRPSPTESAADLYRRGRSGRKSASRGKDGNFWMVGGTVTGSGRWYKCGPAKADCKKYEDKEWY